MAFFFDICNSFGVVFGDMFTFVRCVLVKIQFVNWLTKRAVK
jgi:hypothetical protein